MKHVKVALSGDGGDEFFAGYTIVGDVQTIHVRRSFPTIPAEVYFVDCRRTSLLELWQELSSYAGLAYANSTGISISITRLYFLRKRMLNPEWMLPADAAFLERMLPDNFNSGNDDIVSQVMYFEATNLMTGDFLVKVDRASMAASLEVRCPMLDHRLCGVRHGDSDLVEVEERQGQAHPDRRAGRPIATGVADAGEDGVWGTARPMVPGAAARTGARQPAGEDASSIVELCRPISFVTWWMSTKAAAATTTIKFMLCSCSSCGSKACKNQLEGPTTRLRVLSSGTSG